MAEEQTLKHYRYSGKLSHIGCECLPNGKDVQVTIERISFIDNEVINGDKQAAWVCYFKPNGYFKLPMVLNATNRKRLAKLSGTPYLETVTGLTVTLTQEMDKAIGGGRDWALRISNIKPPQVKQEPTPAPVAKIALSITSANYLALVKWLGEEGHSLAGLLSKYEPDNECLAELKKIKEE